LIKRAGEYIVALRLELERGELEKSGGDIVRQLECICYNSLCGMETAHKYLFFKRAFKVCYKAKNFITAAHFARQVIDLEPTGVSNTNDTYLLTL
jgi:coatomer subunit alpha